MLIPEVLELFRAGKIHEFDADWIGRMKPETQLASARKCMNANPTFMESMAKSRLTHGTPSTQPPRR